MENKEFVNNFDSNNNLERLREPIYGNTQTQSNRKNVEQQYGKKTSSIKIRKIIKGIILFVVGLVVLIFLWSFNNNFGQENCDVSKHF